MSHRKKKSGGRTLWVLGMLLAVWLFQTARSGAATLDWDTATWTAGTTQNSYNVTEDGSYDIRVTIAGSSYQLSSPGTSTQVEGGTGGKTLVIAVNWTTTNTPLTVTIDFFNAGASNVSFTLVDIDRKISGADDGYRDLIYGIKARTTSGTYVGPTTLTGSVSNTATLSGTNSSVVGNGDADNSTTTNSVGDATINFGTNLINQVVFTYGNGSGAPSDPGLQLIAIGDISFKAKMPEVHPALVSGLFCLLPIAVRLYRRRRE